MKMTIELPDNATNGDVLMSLFDVQIGQEYIDGSVKTNLDNTSYFSGEFWYAPYKVNWCAPYGVKITEITKEEK